MQTSIQLGQKKNVRKEKTFGPIISRLVSSSFCREHGQLAKAITANCSLNPYLHTQGVHRQEQIIIILSVTITF